MELGNFRCNFIYYDLFLSLLDFEKDFIKLIDLSQILVADILIGNVFSVFDFFFKRKILIKYFKVPIEKLYNENISDLVEITTKSICDKEMILNNFSGNIVFTELLLSHGFLKYIGAGGKTDYKLAEKCLKESFKTSGNNSYKRFCYSYIFKIRMRRLGFKTQKINGDMMEHPENLNIIEKKNDDNNISENVCNIIKDPQKLKETSYSLSEEDENLYVSKEEQKLLEQKEIFYDDKKILIGNKINKTKRKLFKIYNDSIIEGNLQDFSSSYFYFMGKIFENGWGCKKNDITAYCYYLHGKDAKIKSLGTGSVISYYRRFKSIKKLKSQKIMKTVRNLDKMKNNLFQNLDEKECFICFENDKNTVFFPCMHMVCNGCYDQIKDSARCPACRTKILLIK